MGRKEDIEAVITPALTSLGLYLEDINITSAGKRSLITVIVDGQKHLSLDEVTVATKAISEIVENIASLGSTPFTLEVTSPGVDRPLTKVRHWQKNIDRLVKVIKLDGGQLHGRIKSVNEDYAVIDGIQVKFTDIKRANLEIEFKSVKK
jgi:ribosome maturation factor RimP